MNAQVIDLESYRVESNAKKMRLVLIKLAEDVEFNSPNSEDVSLRMYSILKKPGVTRENIVALLENNDHIFSSQTRFHLIDVYDLLSTKEQTRDRLYQITLLNNDELKEAA